MSLGFHGVGAFLGVLVLIAGCGATTEAPSSSSPSNSASPKSTAAPTSGPVVLTPLLVSVVAPPVAVPTTDGKVHLAYELLLNNVLNQEVTVASAAAKSGDRTLLSLAGDKLSYWMRAAGDPAPTSKLGPGQTGYIWLDVVVDHEDAVPQDLRTPSWSTPRSRRRR